MIVKRELDRRICPHCGHLPEQCLHDSERHGHCVYPCSFHTRPGNDIEIPEDIDWWDDDNRFWAFGVY